MEIQQLRDTRPLQPATPQCEGARVSAYLSDLPGRPRPQCRHSSSYVIRGKHYCKWHAGDVALQILLDQSAEAARK